MTRLRIAYYMTRMRWQASWWTQVMFAGCLYTTFQAAFLWALLPYLKGTP